MHVNDDMCCLSVMNIFFMFKMYFKNVEITTIFLFRYLISLFSYLHSAPNIRLTLDVHNS